MKFTRRSVLSSALFGASYIGLRALVTGIPAAVLLKGRRAFADGTVPTCGDKSKAQYVIFGTSGLGDPLNANAPGTYSDANIAHCLDPVLMPETKMMIGGQATSAALPWTTLPQNVLDRMNVWHIMTNTPVHPKEPDVLSLLGTTTPNEMLPSLLSKQLAPCLGTLQQQPIALGASNPSEGLTFQGQPQPIIPPLALKATLTNPSGPLMNLTNLQSLRDQTLSQINDAFAGGATKAQKAYIDSLVLSQQQVRGIRQDLLSALSSIADNTVASQITAAVTLIQMNVTPVISIHIPFGGDNHNDTALAGEATQTTTGFASIASLMSSLAAVGLQDQVSFVTLNVFGRTIGPGNIDGRQHNPNHQVSLTIGKPFKGGIIGAVQPLTTGDYGAVSITSATGMGQPDGSGDIAPADSLASFGKTVLSAVGVDDGFIESAITFGKVVSGAIA
jgi:hypothetical protein